MTLRIQEVDSRSGQGPYMGSLVRSRLIVWPYNHLQVVTAHCTLDPVDIALFTNGSDIHAHSCFRLCTCLLPCMAAHRYVGYMLMQNTSRTHLNFQIWNSRTDLESTSCLLNLIQTKADRNFSILLQKPFSSNYLTKTPSITYGGILWVHTDEVFSWKGIEWIP